MPNREKVINHFVDAIEASGDGTLWRFVRVDILEDAIALLKAQEPVKTTRDEFDRCYCGDCGGKQIFFQNKDGSIYDSYNHEYITFKEVVRRMVERVGDNGDC